MRPSHGRWFQVAVLGAFVSIVVMAVGAGGLHAQSVDETGRWMLRPAASVILFDLDSDGLNLDADDDVNVTADITYFPTSHVGVNALVGFTSPGLDGIPPGEVSRRPLGSVKALPPTITVEYHPLRTGAVRPYVGVGGNFTYFYDETGTLEAVDTEIDPGLGIAGRAGVRVRATDRLGLSADFRGVNILNDPEVTTAVGDDELDLNFAVVSVGISLRP